MKAVHLAGIGKSYNVGKIICIGRNYSEHIRELGNEVPSEPVIFMKPATSIIGAGEQVVIPPYSDNCHFEVELAILMGKQGKCIPVENARDHIAGYGIAIDMTLRDVQDRLKRKGLPWEKAKAFDTSCPLSDFVAAETITDPQNLGIRLAIDGEMKQDSSTALMMRSIEEIIAAMSESFTLEEGDIILTGTPAGVGSVKQGQTMRAEIDQLGYLEIGIR